MKQLKLDLGSTQGQVIDNQKWVVKTIDGEDNKLDALLTVVKSSVKSNLDLKEFKSYCEAAAENLMVCHADSLTDPATKKKVVKSVELEGDRSRKVVICGLLRRRMKIFRSVYRR